MESKTEKKYFTISEVNNLIHDIFLEIPLFRKIAIRGEVTNYKGPNRAGHFYFSLKDENSIINVVIFARSAYSIKTKIKNGDDIIAFGELNTYAPYGTYQLIINDLELYGQGALLLKREELKKKLEKEGVFNSDHKLKLPQYPINIAVITGKNSAAAVDFKHNLLRRWPIANLTFYNCIVQGYDAPKDIIRALSEAISNKPELIILGRGGGASDDLNAFDDEELVKFIYKMEIPLIAAIGHEINSTFTDFVADEHASTPTGACEIAVPDYQEVLNNLSQLKDYIKTRVEVKIKDVNLKLTTLKNLKVFKDVTGTFDLKLEKLDRFKESIKNSIKTKLELYNQKIKSNKIFIETVNPNNLLNKGYSILNNENNEIITSTKQININDKLIAKLSDGNIKVKVEEVIKNES